MPKNSELRIAGRALALCAITALGILIAEVWTRVDERNRYGTPLLHTPSYRTDLTVHDSLGIRGRPHGVHKKWRLNSAGFRSPESTLVARPGCPAVAILGASETFGYAEATGKEYPAQLADSLRTRGCYRILNTAITGASLVASRQHWNLWVSRFEPKVVVVYLNPLPFLAESAPTRPGRPRTPREDATSFRLRLIERATDRVVFPPFVERLRILRKVEDLENGRPAEWYFPRVPADRLRAFVAAVDSLLVDISSHGAEPVLVFHAMQDTLLTSERGRYSFEYKRQFGVRARSETMVAFDSAAQEAVLTLVKERSTKFVNLRPMLSGRGANFVDLVHFSELGAARVAAALVSAVVAAALEGHAR